MRERLDLVLMDFSLASTDGGIVAFEMRRRRPEVKIAFLCSDPCAPMPTQLVDRVIGKETSPDRLVGEVKELLNA